MYKQVLADVRAYRLLEPGDTVYAAVSGGADSIALLYCLYLLRDKLGISLKAAHFNHHLRGEASNRDEAFVREFCQKYDIPLSVGEQNVARGKKGLECAAREARYAYFRTLPGKVATAHTADDNAETVLLHLVRGTGLKGLGGIALQSGSLLRPMLNVTRAQVVAFLAEYALPHIEDETNAEDDFLRNRLRHHVLPLLSAENPRFAENTSRMAQRLRHDEAALASLAPPGELSISQLRELPEAVLTRYLEQFLRRSGVPEPESAHLEAAKRLVASENPSAFAHFPGNVRISRQYDRLLAAADTPPLAEQSLPLPGTAQVGGFLVELSRAGALCTRYDAFTFVPAGEVRVRSRQPGDEIRLLGGRKSLKKLLIDRKIPAALRAQVPVLYDDAGIIGVLGVAMNLDRAAAALPAALLRVNPITGSESEPL